MLKIKVLPAFSGDAILVTFEGKENTTILVDCGTPNTYRKGSLREEFEKIKKIELLILTHTDQDHIGGILKYYEDINRKQNIFEKIWFNSGLLISNYVKGKEDKSLQIDIPISGDTNMSLKQGLTLEAELEKDKNWHKEIIKAGDYLQTGNLKFHILSPDPADLPQLLNLWDIEKEERILMSYANDYSASVEDLSKNKFIEKGSIQNKTSLAFILEHNENRILFLGDSFSSITEKNLRKLGYSETNKVEIDFVKLSHHGSKHAMSAQLLNIINCDNYIISSNGKYGNPSKETLARIITSNNKNINLYFNYSNDIIKSIFSIEDRITFNFKTIFLTEEDEKYIINCE